MTDLSEKNATVLESLTKLSNATAQDIRRDIDYTMTPMTVTGALMSMERRGLVRRVDVRRDAHVWRADRRAQA
ncbi:MAG: hypothetical protein EOM93_05310 [Gammaproteobacteria bacterium]|nr:hypothetical protein [Gammaproteobacteria bacterium]